MLEACRRAVNLRAASGGYALDGCVEKVAEGAYLFTPANIAIRSDSAEVHASTPKSFLDRR